MNTETIKGNFYSYFNNVTNEEIEQALIKLNDADCGFILKAHGGNLSNELKELNESDKKRYYVLLCQIKKLIKEGNKTKVENQLPNTTGHRAREWEITDNIESDFLKRVPEYKRVSSHEQKKLIKIIKMSFYETATSEEQARYIEYFKEEYPWFKEKMDSEISEEEKNIVIDEVINIALEARNSFVENNLRLVAKVAASYRNRGIPYVDLIQEGTFGLVKALEKFDIAKDNTFSTYAVFWINQRISRYIGNNFRTIRIPIHQSEFMNKVKRTEDDLMNKMGTKPTLEQIAEELEVSAQKVKQAKEDFVVFESLDKPITDGENTTLGQFIADQKSDFTEDIHNNIIRGKLIDILETLPQRDKEILFMRFGFDDGVPKSLQEIGKRFGISKERVCRIELKLLRQLRTNDEVRKIYQSSDIYENSSLQKTLVRQNQP